MSNENNLIPFDARTKEEARALGSKGGKASGESRRRKRDARMVAEMVLALKPEINDRLAAQIQQIGYKKRADPDLLALAMMTVAAKATRGDLKAFRFLLEISGQMQPQAVVELQDDGFLEALANTGREVFADGGMDEPTDTNV